MASNDKRPFKGRSIIDFPNDYVIVDIETTGLSSDYDSIIEISALRIRDNEITDTFDSLVLEDGAYIDNFIEQLTGITQAMISGAPPIVEVLPNFISFVDSDIIIGQNISFDINFLYDRCLKYSNELLINNHVDIARISRKLYKDAPHHRLEDIANRYGIDYSSAHRGLADCKITYQALNELKQDIINQHGSFDKFIDLFRSSNRFKNYVRAKDIVAECNDFDEDNLFYQRHVVFTGELDTLTRKEAYQLVANIGGICQDSITQKTNFLVLGNIAYANNVKDGKTNKFKKALEYKLKGQDIIIIDESLFLEIVNGGHTDEPDT